MANMSTEIQWTELDAENVLNAHKINDSFCQCIHNLLGPTTSYSTDQVDDVLTGNFEGLTDVQVQSLEEIIGHTIWEVTTFE